MLTWKDLFETSCQYINNFLVFNFLFLLYIYIYTHTHKKNNFIVCDRCKHKKIQYFFIQIYFRTVFLVSVCCVKDKCWKFSIYYKFTIKELLKLIKGITWRHSNIVLKSEKIKFTNTLKNNVKLVEEINGTKGTKQLQNNKTNIEDKTACLPQLTNRGRRSG